MSNYPNVTANVTLAKVPIKKRRISQLQKCFLDETCHFERITLITLSGNSSNLQSARIETRPIIATQCVRPSLLS